MDIGLLAGLGIDSLIVATLYYYLKKRAKTLIDIQNASEFDINLMKDVGKEAPKVIEYGMIVGKLAPADSLKVLHSNFNKEYRGVLRILELKEHTSSIRDNVVRDSARLMSRIVNHESFKILKKNMQVLVDQPLEASYLEENLHTTYNNFAVNMDSLTSKVVTAIIAKETVKGVETTERMLLTGTTLTCFGKLEQMPYSSSSPSWIPGAVKAQYRLSPPSNDYTYIITSMSKSELIERLKNTTKFLRISLVIFGTIGAGLGIYLSYNHVKAFVDKKRREYRLNQARLRRIAERRARAQDRVNDASNPDQQSIESNETSCVICLINPREVILLDCGHVCLCMDCLEQMPSQSCPICRENYRTFAPAYIA